MKCKNVVNERFLCNPPHPFLKESNLFFLFGCSNTGKRRRDAENDDGRSARSIAEGGGPVKELIRLVIQTLLRECTRKAYKSASTCWSIGQICPDACWNGCRHWRGDRWTWGDFLPVSRSDGRSVRRKAPSTRNRPLRCS